MAVPKVNESFLGELEAMGFPLAQATRALHYSGNSSIEDAVNWIVDHENDQDIDQMPLISADIDIGIDSTEQFSLTEEMKRKAHELRDRAMKKNNEEEKKRLRREGEKERIRSGKELMEAKRALEENERKRYLALKQSEKEEEKKAKEKIRWKLEQDKLERSSKLQMPLKSPTKHSIPVVQQKQIISVPVVSVSKAELMSECLRSLKHNHMNNEAKVRKAFQTLLTYVGNVARNPDQEKFRKIRMSNPIFQERVGSMKGGVEFLELCGFERREEGEEFLYLPRENVNMAVLNSAGSELKSAITNPFFGVFSLPKEEKIVLG